MSYINYYLMNTKISVGPGAVEELSKALKELKVKKIDLDETKELIKTI